MDAFKVADALDSAMTLARRANKYIDETTPWALAKDESRKDELATVIYNLLESLRILGVLFGSSMPEASAKILASLGVSDSSLESASTFGLLPAGEKVGESFVLFARIDEQKKLAEIEAELAENK